MPKIFLGINNATDVDLAIVAAVFIGIPVLVILLIAYVLKNSGKSPKNALTKI